MIGDDLGNDVEGAIAAGLDAVWVNRFGHPPRPDLVEVDSLGALNENDAKVRAASRSPRARC